MLIFMAALFVPAALPCFAAAGGPGDVVSRFCELDFEGHRLSASGYESVKPLVSYPAEPGWDRVLGIRSDEVGEESIDGSSARVLVRYEIDRFWPDDLEDTGKYREETFTLSREGDWKINRPIPLPRVSTELLCREYDNCAAGMPRD